MNSSLLASRYQRKMGVFCQVNKLDSSELIVLLKLGLIVTIVVFGITYLDVFESSTLASDTNVYIVI
ncbi:hypothetical protein CONCODRAFT_11833 [Conidiobolus coronatus NRRL 28638]|uniref:Uncharacterized protein n=1 Tax=Conidiobolus coronatus (strain ATCC 28846 / CBS 209.66 / NRRL 28638) TaxID=796925 RepID=A0A137NU67_CONC2|nr:hypothetical protein CONCODRAFT_11833 [Conidiobolus coronatus NRRL 28638]|eukprot:KXN66355.1 hypothetical protein CONCODRAFT_11833 [Conidiobolus coronatus NRRL 28638]